MNRGDGAALALGGEVVAADLLPPVPHLARKKGIALLGAARHDVSPLFLPTRVDVGNGQCAVPCLFHTLEDQRRCPGTPGKCPPVRRFEPGVILLRKTRHVRHRASPAGGGDAARICWLMIATFDVNSDTCPASASCSTTPTPTVRHVRRPEGFLLQQQSGQDVGQTADAGGGKAKSARPRLRRSDKLVDGAPRLRPVDDQRQRGGRHQAHRRQSLNELVGRPQHGLVRRSVVAGEHPRLAIGR